MSKIKYGLVAGATALAFSVSNVLPTFAELCEAEEEGCVVQSDNEVLVRDPDGSLLQNTDGDLVALSTVTVTPTNISVALGEEKNIAVSYNEGFNVEDIDNTETSIELKEGDDDWIAYVGFDGEYDYETGTFNADWNSIYVYGNIIGTATYTVTVTDNEENVATADFTVTTEDALGSAYGGIEDPDAEDSYTVNYEAGVTFSTPVAGGRKLKLALVPMTDALQALDDKLSAVLEINVVGEDNNVIPVSDNNTEMWFGVRKEMLGEFADAEELYFQVVYIDNGAIVKYFDVHDIEDDGWGWMFDVDGINHFSQYGILVSDAPFEDAESRNASLSTDEESASAPDSGAFTGNGDFSVAGGVGAVAILGVIVAAVGVVKFSRRGIKW